MIRLPSHDLLGFVQIEARQITTSMSLDLALVLGAPCFLVVICRAVGVRGGGAGVGFSVYMPAREA